MVGNVHHLAHHFIDDVYLFYTIVFITRLKLHLHQSGAGGATLYLRLHDLGFPLRKRTIGNEVQGTNFIPLPCRKTGR